MTEILFFSIALIGLCSTFSIVCAKFRRDKLIKEFEKEKVVKITFKRNLTDIYWNLNGLAGTLGYIYLLFYSFKISILHGVFYFLMCGLSCVIIFFISDKLKLLIAILAPFYIYSLFCLI